MTLRLGELIDSMKRCKKDASVIFDFGGAVPTGIDSWRGVYAELSLQWGGGRYGDDYPKVSDVLEILSAAVGKTYTGWKGGEYRMDRDTPVWVDNRGCWTKTAIVGVSDEDYIVVLQTERRRSV